MRLFPPSYGQKDALFLAITFFTLCLFACFFALHQDHQAYSAYCAAADHAKEESCKLDKPFSEKLIGDPAALFTAVLAVLTLVLAVVGVGQIYFLLRADKTGQRAADAAKQSADAAKDALIASNRPWLKAHLEIGNQPLFLQKDSASCAFAVKIENIGNAPALNVTYDIWFLTYNNIVGSSLQDEQKGKCEFVHSNPTGFSFTLFLKERFPNITGTENFLQGISMNEADMSIAVRAGNASNEENAVIVLFVGGCVAYTIPNDEPGRHVTSFMYVLDGVYFGPNGIDMVLFIPGCGAIPPEKLRLSPMMFGKGSYAD